MVEDEDLFAALDDKNYDFELPEEIDTYEELRDSQPGDKCAARPTSSAGASQRSEEPLSGKRHAASVRPACGQPCGQRAASDGRRLALRLFVRRRPRRQASHPPALHSRAAAALSQAADSPTFPPQTHAADVAVKAGNGGHPTDRAAREGERSPQSRAPQDGRVDGLAL